MNENMAENIIKSKDRVQELGEVYTPSNIVNLGIGLIENKIINTDAKILEPACGNGNFIIGLLDKKIRFELCRNNLNKYTIALIISNIYGIDIKYDNIYETKQRILDLISKYIRLKEDNINTLKYILDRNIIWGNTLDSKQYIKSINIARADLMFKRRRVTPREDESNLIIVDWGIGIDNSTGEIEVNRVDYLYNNLDLAIHNYNKIGLNVLTNQVDNF